MSAQDQLRKIIENALEKWALGVVTKETAEPAQEPIKQVRQSEAVENGYRFQRCGGGRRVIKRQRGGSY